MGLCCLWHVGLAVDLFDGTANVIFYAAAQVVPNGTEVKGFVRFDGGMTVASGSEITCNIIPPICGPIGLNNDGKITLSGDMMLGANVTLASGGIIDGNNHVIFLQSDLIIPAGQTLTFVSNTTIDGQGHRLIFAQATNPGRLVIDGDEDTNVTLKNITIEGIEDTSTTHRSIQFGEAEGQSLTLDTVCMILRENYTFQGGGITIMGDTVIQGNKMFTFAAAQDLLIKKNACFALDMDVEFRYSPSDRSKTHIVFEDSSSVLFLNGCMLSMLRTQPLILTKGHLVIDHKTYIYGSGANRSGLGIIWGDGTNDNNLLVDIMPGASVEVIEGFLTYNNIDDVNGSGSGWNRGIYDEQTR
ncbi:MAG: hypothetical protein US69_C0024G0007 [candidate division TM6 bacterium GW2011_GWF2_38_10]|nr:MAG: hypothetical protein US69_C0024G0007 [candidate division TM6 bacterium GW2011_GWF2_38_10]